MNSRTTQRLLWGLLAVALVCLGGYSLFKSVQSKPEKLQDLGAIPHFTLIDQSGRPVTQNDLRGHVWVADMIFTHCTSTCPMLTEKMFALQTALQDQPDVRLVSLSVDPTHDSPDTLRNYAFAHKADPTRWSFLTGPVRTIYSLAKDGFHLPLDSVGGDQTTPIIHSPRFVLVDPNGHMRGYYDGNKDESRPGILNDIANLKREFGS